MYLKKKKFLIIEGLVAETGPKGERTFRPARTINELATGESEQAIQR